MIGVELVDEGESAFAAGDVDAILGGVVEEIVGVADALHVGH